VDVIKLDENIHLLKFSPEGNSFIGFNMLIIIDGNDCILLDTGYERQFVVINEYLKSVNLNIKQVIISHFHNDHIGGIPSLRHLPIHGSIFARDTLAKYKSNDIDYSPTNPVIGEKEINFGKNNIKIINNPGHSKDGTIIVINNRFMFVGDDIIMTDKGEPVIPFCADQDLFQQKKGIEKIKTIAKDKIIIPSHCELLKNNFDIFKDLDNRLIYLNYFIMNDKASYNLFVNETFIDFKGSKWHLYNMNLKRSR